MRRVWRSTSTAARRSGCGAGDQLRLGQVLLNIAGNAIKFTERVRWSVDVSVGRTTYGQEELRFAVRDTGIGMTADQRAKLFQSFSQADASISRRFGGTGLGLAISKAFVDLMGGTIAIDSTPGVGTTFTVTIPCRRTARAPIAAEVPAELEGDAAHALRGVRLLLADDHPINQEIAAALLGEAGAEVHIVGDGRRALAAVLDDPARFDAVLMDVEMPDMNGLEATSRIRAAGYEQLPIIAMTAHALVEERARCVAAGMNDHVTKPLDPAVLIATVARWTQRAPGRAAAVAPPAPSALAAPCRARRAGRLSASRRRRSHATARA